MSKSDLRSPTFSPEAMQAIVQAVTAQVLAGKGKQAGKPAKAPAKAPLVDGKTAKQIANEKATIRAFKKAGFGTVVPHVDVLTFGRWNALGMRPIEGSKAVKAGSLRLFHKSQVRPLTDQEKGEVVEPSNVTELRPE